MHSLAGCLVLAMLVSACGSNPATVFNTTLTNPDGEFPLPVSLRDETELVVRFGGAQVDPVTFRNPT